MADNDDNILISIIIPVKDGGKFINHCLTSILNQTYRSNLEVSIYDDGSTDNTSDLIQSFIPKFNREDIRVTYSHGDEARGVGYAKNQAVLQSSGKYLCFQDIDDIMMPDRIELQCELMKEMEKEDNYVFIGSHFIRDPVGSTSRYTNWACRLNNDELMNQIYTSFGPTVISPTWFIQRKLYDLVGGFNQDYKKGFPEDLEFFYKALPFSIVNRVQKPLVVYRFHSECATFQVNEKTIFELRLKELERNVLPSWEEFTIWSGKQGRQFYRSLSIENQKKVVAFCDVSKKRIDYGHYEFYDEMKREVTSKIPIIDQKYAKPPVIICVKLDMTNGKLEEYLSLKKWRENVDYIHFG